MHEFFYEKEGDEFLLVERDDTFGRDIIWRGPEVAIGFTYDPDQDRGIQYTTHRHGSPETVAAWAEKQRIAIELANQRGIPLEAWANPYTISTDQWDLEDLNRIISTTGYLAVVITKMGIDLTSG